VIENVANFLLVAFMAAIVVAALNAFFQDDRAREQREEALRSGVEVEAEVLGRFEAGAPQGSKKAKARLAYMASWDPRELELRYVFEGREIVSRCRVSSETFIHTRGMKRLKIKVSPDRPEQWAVVAPPNR
jgi:hypothetical protein